LNKDAQGQSLARVFYVGCTEWCTVFGFSLQVLDLTYPCYKMCEDREKAKGRLILF